jgi:hypothetical protein
MTPRAASTPIALGSTFGLQETRTKPLSVIGHVAHPRRCVERASTYMLTETEARELIGHQVDVIEREWDEVCERARMAEVERSFFWRRQFLNPYAFEGYSPAPV